ncbi:hypothetical protein ACLKA7_007883 [Drosophila subpalustris]
MVLTVVLTLKNPFLAEFDGIKWFKGGRAVAITHEEFLRFLKDTIHSVGEPGRLKVVQINLLYSSVPSIDLLQYMAKERVDVALVQEPWIVRACGLSSRGYHILVPHPVETAT